MNERGVDFLDSMDAVGRYDETVIRHFCKSPAILAEPGDGEHFTLARGFESVDEIGRFAAGADSQGHIAGLAKQFELVDEDARVIEIVADGGDGTDVRHERNDGEGFSFLDDRMSEFDAEMERIAEAATISHDEQLFARTKTFGHIFGHCFDLFGVFREEFFLHLDTFAALAKNFVAIGLGRFFDEGCAHGIPIWLRDVVAVAGKAA